MKAFKHEQRGPAASGGTPIRTGFANRIGLEQPVKKPIQRTSAGLRDALFDAIEKVREGEMAPEDASALSKLAAQICNTVHLEISVAKLRTEYPADAKLIVPSPLQLGVKSDEPDEKT